MQCPECKTRMDDGYVPARGGIFWHRKGEKPGLFSFAKGLPGTAAWLRTAKLEAYHCPRCRLILFRYGKTIEQIGDFEHK